MKKIMYNIPVLKLRKGETRFIGEGDGGGFSARRKEL